MRRILVAILAMLQAVAVSMYGQGPNQSATELVHYLGRPLGPIPGVFVGCSSLADREAEDAQATKSLMAVGVAGLEAIRTEVRSIETEGDKYDYALAAGPLFKAYLAASHREAMAKLLTMLANPELQSYGPQLEWALSGSLGLTSFRTTALTNWKARTFCGTKTPEPSDAVDQSLLAWIDGDQEHLEASLGPVAKQALAEWRKGPGCKDRSPECMGARPTNPSAFAYELVAEGAASGSLTDDASPTKVYVAKFAMPVGSCRSVRFTTRKVNDANGRRVVLENGDIAEVLRQASTCLSPLNEWSQREVTFRSGSTERR